MRGFKKAKMNKTIQSITIISSIVLLLSGCEKPEKHSPKAMFRANLQHTGVYETKGVHQLNELKWAFKTEGPIRSSPAVADGVVYFGSYDGNLYAVDIKTGKEKWRFKTGGKIFSSPAVADGVVYFGSHDGKLYAVQ